MLEKHRHIAIPAPAAAHQHKHALHSRTDALPSTQAGPEPSGAALSSQAIWRRHRAPHAHTHQRKRIPRPLPAKVSVRHWAARTAHTSTAQAYQPSQRAPWQSGATAAALRHGTVRTHPTTHTRAPMALLAAAGSPCWSPVQSNPCTRATAARGPLHSPVAARRPPCVTSNGSNAMPA